MRDDENMKIAEKEIKKMLAACQTGHTRQITAY